MRKPPQSRRMRLVLDWGDLGDQLRQAIDEGFTSTEILMRVRSVLVDSRTSLAEYPELQSRSQALIGGIAEALR